MPYFSYFIFINGKKYQQNVSANVILIKAIWKTLVFLIS